jgi:hypothetical protein
MSGRLQRPQSGVIKPAVAGLVANGESSGAQEIMRQHKQNVVNASLFLSNAKKIN